MNKDQVISLLRKETASAPTMKAWAQANGISPQYTVDVLQARRAPGKSVLRVLGLERVVTYRRLQE